MAYKDEEKRKANARKHNYKHYVNRTPAQKQADLDRAAKYRKDNKELLAERRRARRLSIKYGMTPEQYAASFESQGRCCSICKADKPGSKSGWHVDHCHATGKVRGILCACCNVMLGQAKDNEYTLFEAIAYLLKHRGVDNVGR